MKIKINFQQRESTTVSDTVFAKEVQVRPQIQLGPIDQKDINAIRNRLVAAFGKRKAGQIERRFIK